MSGDEADLAERIRGRRGELRALEREIRWLKRFAVVLAMVDVVGIAVVVVRLHWENFGG